MGCGDGSIALNGSVDCNNQQVQRDICDSASCWYTISGKGSPSWAFSSWSGASVTIGCRSCATTTLTVHVPSVGLHYTGSLDLNVDQPGVVEVAVHTFVNWSSGWVPGDVEACANNCTSGTGGGSLSLWKGFWYTLSTVNVPSWITVSQWNVTAGPFNGSGHPNAVYVERSGIIAVSMVAFSTQDVWAGWVVSPNSSSEEITSASATMQLSPTANSAGSWVGIGGDCYNIGSSRACTPLWQAGVAESNNGTAVAFAISIAANGTETNFWDYAHPFGQSDNVSVSVGYASGTSFFSVTDLTKRIPYSGHMDFTPYLHSAEWVWEWKSGTPQGFPTFSNLSANNASLGLGGSFLGLDTPRSVNGGDGNVLVDSLSLGVWNTLTFTFRP